jgi:hypothetical protein
MWFGGSFEAEHKRDALQKRIGELEAELELVKVVCGVKGTTLGSLWASHTERPRELQLVNVRNGSMCNRTRSLAEGSDGFGTLRYT